MKRMKKLWALLLVILLLAATPCFAFGAEVASGSCGANLHWSLSSLGHLTVTGSGRMTDACVWSEYADRIKSVSLPSGLTTIGAGAFEQCRSLTSVNIPDNVTSIGIQAFSYCKGLQSVSLPKKLTTIGNKAFQYCESLETVTIPSGVTVIDAYTFMGCAGLQAVFLPVSVREIRFNAFKNCFQMKTLFYAGTERDWRNVDIDSGNECLLADALVIKYGAKGIDSSYHQQSEDGTSGGIFGRILAFFRSLLSRFLSIFSRK